MEKETSENNWKEKEKWKSKIVEFSVIPIGIYNYPLYIFGRLRAWWERGKGHRTVLMVLSTDSTKILQRCEVRVYRILQING